MRFKYRGKVIRVGKTASHRDIGNGKLGMQKKLFGVKDTDLRNIFAQTKACRAFKLF